MRSSDLQDLKGHTARPTIKTPSSKIGSSVSWQTWLVLFFMGFLIISIEFYDHYHMHQAHGIQESIFSDIELIREIVMFGMVAPIITGLLLTLLQRAKKERDEYALEIRQRRKFAKQMNEAEDWDQLADLIVTYPGSLTPATNAYLMVRKSQDNQFYLTSEWSRQGNEPTHATPLISPDDCDKCSATNNTKFAEIITCQQYKPLSNEYPSTRYCLSLATSDDEKAILAFDLPREHSFSSQERRFLEDVGLEMALAIENAHLFDKGQRLSEATRSERLRIARNLHDTLGQNITYLRMKLEKLSVENTLSEIVDIQKEIIRMHDVAVEASNQVKDTLADLRAENQSSLSDALLHHAKKVGDRAGFSVQIQNHGQMSEVPPHLQRQALYIGREALNNVEKHANAQHVKLEIYWQDSGLILKVIDDGQGFDENVRFGEGHYGITIMEERSKALNGNLTITSKPGQGTKVCFQMPFESLPSNGS